jgi:hypothetical protein
MRSRCNTIESSRRLGVMPTLPACENNTTIYKKTNVNQQPESRLLYSCNDASRHCAVPGVQCLGCIARAADGEQTVHVESRSRPYRPVFIPILKQDRPSSINVIVIVILGKGSCDWLVEATPHPIKKQPCNSSSQLSNSTVLYPCHFAKSVKTLLFFHIYPDRLNRERNPSDPLKIFSSLARAR